MLEDGKRVLGKRFQRFCTMWHEDLNSRYSRLDEVEGGQRTLFELRVKYEGDWYDNIVDAHMLARAVEGTIVSVPPFDERDEWEWSEYRVDLHFIRDVGRRQHREDGHPPDENIWHQGPKGAKNRVGMEEFLYWACGGARFLVKLKTKSLQERDQAIARLRTDPRVFAVGPTNQVPLDLMEHRPKYGF